MHEFSRSHLLTSLHTACRPGFWLAVISYITTLSVSWGKYGQTPNLPATVKETVPSIKVGASGPLSPDLQTLDQVQADEIHLELPKYPLQRMHVS